MTKRDTLIIAEAGVNHDGKLDQALELVQIASECGADIVKFQMFKAENLVSKNASKANYQKIFYENETQFQMLKKLELNKKEFQKIKKHCDILGIKFLCSVFDRESLNFIKKLNVDQFKIPSGEINNLPYLREIGKFNKNIILSTGISTLEEIAIAIENIILSGTNRSKINLLHCSSEYPAPFAGLNLFAIKTLAKEFNVNVGFSDHTKGIEASIAAVAIGANIIEKHFTLDKKLKGPDHSSSLDPKELRDLVSSIRNIEISLGSGLKIPNTHEIKNLIHIRKSIFASRAISKGEKFSEKNITAKRPGNGISPMLWDKVIGQEAKKNFSEDELITL